MADMLLPPPLAGDKRFEALENIVGRLNAIDLAPLLVYLVDTVDASALPLLANQFHILGEGWQFARNATEQRKLLKRAMELHRYKGTRWAIEQVLETLMLSGQITEWFEYGGQPYHFRMNVDLSDQGIDLKTFDNLVALVHEYKNVRSSLELLILSLSTRSQIPVMAMATLAGELGTVYPYVLTELRQTSNIYLGVAHWSVETVSLFPLPTDGARQHGMTDD